MLELHDSFSQTLQMPVLDAHCVNQPAQAVPACLSCSQRCPRICAHRWLVLLGIFLCGLSASFRIVRKYK